MRYSERCTSVTFASLFCFIIFLVGTPTFSQTIIGIQPYGTYATSQIDKINLADLGVHIDIPLYSHAARGAIAGVQAHLIYDTSYRNLMGQLLVDSGWRLVAGAASTQGTTLTSLDRTQVSGGNCFAFYSFAFVDPTGYSHFFNGEVTERFCGGTPGSGNISLSESASDGSGYFLQANAPVVNQLTKPASTVTSPSGIQNSNGLIVDTNGNQFPVTVTGGTPGSPGIQTISDDAGVALGVTAAEPVNSPNPYGGDYNTQVVNGFTQLISRNPAYVQYTDPNGSPQQITITYTMGQATAKGAQFPTGLVDSVTFPDQTAYHFTYDSNGDLASAKLPTGGTINYATTYNSSPTYCHYPIAMTRTTSDGQVSYALTVNSTLSTDPCIAVNTTTTVAKPNGSETVNFVLGSAGVAFVLGNTAVVPSFPLETAHVWSSSSGVTVQSTMKCYNGATGDCTTTPITIPISQIASTLTLDDGSTVTRVEYRNSAGLSTESDEYDLGASALTRKTVTAYAPLGNNIQDRPASVTVYDASGNIAAQTTYGYDESTLASAPSGLLGHQSVSGSRGNRTSSHQWLDTLNATLDTHFTFDEAGAMVGSQDPRLNWTYFTYDSTTDSCVLNTAYPSPSSGVSVATSGTCDPNTGVVTSTTDFNGTTTSYLYDSMFRPTSSTAKRGSTLIAKTATIYSGATLPSTTTVTVSASPSPDQTTTTILDGYGRITTRTAPSGAIVDTTYDSSGLLHSVSNPYFSTSDSTYGITTFGYDSLGRKTSQTQPDKNVEYWSYLGPVITFKDENLNQWRRTYDGLGRLTSVLEPSSTSQLPSLETDYKYNTLDNLTQVNQVGITGELPRVRSFTYDSLSRLICASNPENSTNPCPASATATIPSGVVALTYDLDSNLSSRTDARGVITNYIYDALNRVILKSYSDTTPPVLFNYDEHTVAWTSTSLTNTTGRLSSASVGGSTVYSRVAYRYDAAGRQQYKLFQSPNSTGTGVGASVGSASFQYDLAGNVVFADGGKGVQFTTTRDKAGHVTAARANKHTTGTLNGVSSFQMFANATYSPFGAPSTRLLGNGLTETRTYDQRGRLLTSSQSLSGSSIGYTASAGYSGSGTLTSSSDSVNGNWTYSYDPLNRLKTATSDSGLTLNWTYDSFGNRLSQFVTGSGVAPQPNFTFSSNTNRADASGGFAYDLAGDITTDNFGQSYTYDAENRVQTVVGPNGTTTFKYDTDGQLIYENGPSGIQVFVRDSSGNATSITNPATPNGPPYSVIGAYIDGEHIGSWQHDQFYWTGKDWKGTKRYQTAGNGDIASTAVPIGPIANTSLPYGDALNSIGKDPTHLDGKERDLESGNDYYGARYYSSSTGRFMSPDSNPAPDPIPYADITNPQSLNLYSYVLNNPITNTDPDGHDCIDTSNLERDGTVTVTAGISCAANLGPNGTYINGTINTSTLTTDGKGSVGYDFTSYDGQTGGGGVIVPSTPYGPLEGPANRAGVALIGSWAKPVNIVGGVEMAVISSELLPLLGPVSPEIGLGVGGVGTVTKVGSRRNPVDVPRGTNAPTTINGRYYTGHALDEMQSSGIVPSMVEETIAHGTSSPGNTAGTTVHDLDGLRVVTNSDGGVITTTPRGR
jgi:RHS repeat-associated protein